MSYLILLPSILAGFILSNIFSQPGSRIRKRLPKLKIKHFEILPSMRIHISGRIIHFHHWFNFSIILVVSFFISSNLLDSFITRGLLAGGIIQGLRFPDASRVIYRKEEASL